MPADVHFLVIGAQKCATTWLYECLREHPGIFMPPSKREIEYLGSPLYQGNDDAYLELFRDAPATRRAGDASVEYLYDPDAPARVARVLGRPLAIASLRNPIDRAISAFHWYVRKQTTTETDVQSALAAVLDAELRGESHPLRDLLRRGLYGEQIERWARALGSDRVIVTLYDEIALHPQRVLAGLYGAIGVAPDFVPPSIGSRPKLNTYSRLTLMLERALPHRPGGGSMLNKVFTRISQTVNETVLRQRAESRRPTLTPALRAELRRYFAERDATLVRTLHGVRTIGSADTVGAWS